MGVLRKEQGRDSGWKVESVGPEAADNQGSWIFGKQNQCYVKQRLCGEEVGQADPLRLFPGKASCIRPMCTEHVQH